MERVVIADHQSESLQSQLVALYTVFSQIKNGEKYNFDLSGSNACDPLLILPVAAYIHDTGSDFNLPKNANAKAYFQDIKFPGGTIIIPNASKSKDIIPIGFFSASSDAQSRENLLSSFQEMLYKVLGKVPGTMSAIYYPTAELVTNIFEHSKKDEGWIMAHINSAKNYLDLCILDRGRGLRATYKEEKNLELSDKEALAQAMIGHSTKSDHERGYGIRTSKRVVCEALGGSFMILSGNASLIADHRDEEMVHLDKFSWPGVIIGYRIPFPARAIDISIYLE